MDQVTFFRSQLRHHLSTQYVGVLLRCEYRKIFLHTQNNLLGSDLEEQLRERCRRDRVCSVVKATAKKVHTKLQAMTTVATHRLYFMLIQIERTANCTQSSPGHLDELTSRCSGFKVTPDQIGSVKNKIQIDRHQRSISYMLILYILNNAFCHSKLFDGHVTIKINTFTFKIKDSFNCKLWIHFKCFLYRKQ